MKIRTRLGKALEEGLRDALAWKRGDFHAASEWIVTLPEKSRAKASKRAAVAIEAIRRKPTIR